MSHEPSWRSGSGQRQGPGSPALSKKPKVIPEKGRACSQGTWSPRSIERTQRGAELGATEPGFESVRGNKVREPKVWEWRK